MIVTTSDETDDSTRVSGSEVSPSLGVPTVNTIAAFPIFPLESSTSTKISWFPGKNSNIDPLGITLVFSLPSIDIETCETG